MPDGTSPGERPSGVPRDSGRLLARRYRMLTEVGRGGMGTVWHAHDEVLGRDVAVKEVILPHGLTDEEREVQYKRTFREARTAARLSHPGVVRVYDVVEEDGRPWIVMELIRARSLAQVIKEEGPLSIRRAAAIVSQMLGALNEAHTAGILHRDVKPSNVLVTAGDRAVLTDFGIATVQGDTTLTQTGLVMGSPAYIAPERARGRRAQPASDLWSLGVTLYAAVEGRSPFERSEPMACLIAVLTDEPEPPRHAGPLRPVIEGLLRKDPDQRLTVGEAARLLDPIASAAARAPRHTLPMPRLEEELYEGPVGGAPVADDPSGAAPAAVHRDEEGSADGTAAESAGGPAAAVAESAEMPAEGASPEEPAGGSAEDPAESAEGAGSVDGPATAELATGDSQPPEPSAGRSAPAEPEPAAGKPTADSVAHEPDQDDQQPASVERESAGSGPAAARRAEGEPAPGGRVLPPAPRRPADDLIAPADVPETLADELVDGPPRSVVRRRPIGPVALLAAAVVLAILGGWYLFGAGDEPEPKGGTAGGTGRSPVSSASATAQPRPSGRPAVPAGYRIHRDRTGFSLAVPKGWSGPEGRGTSVYFYSGDRRTYLQIDQTDDPGSDALEDWRRQEAATRGSTFPNYQRIRLEPVMEGEPVSDSTGKKAADWEFTWNSGSGERRVLDRGFVAGGHGYAILISAPAGEWEEARAFLEPAFTTFKPAAD